MKCNKCGNTIPEGRLKAVPTTKVCTPCSTESPYYANQIVKNDEEYTELEFVKDPATILELNRLRAISIGKISHNPD
jgi:hypothetical protein